MFGRPIVGNLGDLWIPAEGVLLGADDTARGVHRPRGIEGQLGRKMAIRTATTIGNTAGSADPVRVRIVIAAPGSGAICAHHASDIAGHGWPGAAIQTHGGELPTSTTRRNSILDGDVVLWESLSLPL